ncbi:hypothetical protein OQH61_08715 [Helicobacter sp. MIT 21-1697]|uniref:hypothetical protein n=1 Tax=Helicobacter sp. MIT 21-1697 TaxID=2993733 RepID=UPI00224AE55A|nr:hypothetical protein [Helicobacter sp. MIT 21-1697]MCX2717812.1 hypothetical protein [Helicobacter sp. MIT 21-1697]
MIEKLRFRATHSLANPSEVTDEVLHIALKESEEICKDRDVKDYARLDIAYIRLKLYLKIALEGQDELLLKNALNVVEQSPLICDDGQKTSGTHYQSDIRESVYC